MSQTGRPVARVMETGHWYATTAWLTRCVNDVCISADEESTVIAESFTELMEMYLAKESSLYGVPRDDRGGRALQEK